MQTRRSLVGHVGNDLSKNEQETGVSFFGDSEECSVFSYRPTFVRSILLHEQASIDWVATNAEHARPRRVDAEDLAEIDVHQDGLAIEGVRAFLPLGCLSIKGIPRASNRISSIVKTPDQASRARESFAADGGESE
jgi:hypothetical protein